NPLVDEPLILTVALNQAANGETASATAATAMSMSYFDQRSGSNHAAMAEKTRARLSRGRQLVKGHLMPSIGPRHSVIVHVLRGLPAQFTEPVVVNPEMVRDLVDDSPAHLVGDLLLAAGDRADRLPVNRDAVRQYPGVLRGAIGQRNALVEPEQP